MLVIGIVMFISSFYSMIIIILFFTYYNFFNKLEEYFQAAFLEEDILYFSDYH